MLPYENLFYRGGKPPSSAGNKVSKWVSKLRPTASVDSIGAGGNTNGAMPEVEPIGPLEAEMTLARSNTDYRKLLCSIH